MTVIVGAGAAGLSLGVMLDGKVTIYEAADGPGGLCRSTQIDGFTWDTGPHILGGIPDAVAWIVASTGLDFLPGSTNNVGWIDGEWCAHPFTNPDDGDRYMRKMWKADPGQLSPGGLSAQAGRKPGGVSTFLYPAHGGYQAITDAWAARLDGAVNYRTVIETPSDIERSGLVWTGPVAGRYNRLVTVTVGLEGKPPPYTAVYLPGRETPFHRLSFPAAFSPHNAPDGCYSIQAEASLRMQDTPDLGAFAEEAADTFDRLGFYDEPLFVDVQDIPNAYPLPDGTESAGHGRTGGHRYLNLDGVVSASMALAKNA